MESERRKRNASFPVIYYCTPELTFGRVFKEDSLDKMKQVARAKLGLPLNSSLVFEHIRDGEFVALQDEDDFDAFCCDVHGSASARIRVQVETVPQKPKFVDFAVQVENVENDKLKKPSQTTKTIAIPFVKETPDLPPPKKRRRITSDKRPAATRQKTRSVKNPVAEVVIPLEAKPFPQELAGIMNNTFSKNERTGQLSEVSREANATASESAGIDQAGKRKIKSRSLNQDTHPLVSQNENRSLSKDSDHVISQENYKIFTKENLQHGDNDDCEDAVRSAVYRVLAARRSAQEKLKSLVGDNITGSSPTTSRIRLGDISEITKVLTSDVVAYSDMDLDAIVRGPEVPKIKASDLSSSESDRTGEETEPETEVALGEEGEEKELPNGQRSGIATSYGDDSVADESSSDHEDVEELEEAEVVKSITRVIPHIYSANPPIPRASDREDTGGVERINDDSSIARGGSHFHSLNASVPQASDREDTRGPEKFSAISTTTRVGSRIKSSKPPVPQPLDRENKRGPEKVNSVPGMTKEGTGVEDVPSTTRSGSNFHASPIPQASEREDNRTIENVNNIPSTSKARPQNQSPNVPVPRTKRRATKQTNQKLNSLQAKTTGNEASASSLDESSRKTSRRSQSLGRHPSLSKISEIAKLHAYFLTSTPAATRIKTAFRSAKEMYGRDTQQAQSESGSGSDSDSNTEDLAAQSHIPRGRVAGTKRNLRTSRSMTPNAGRNVK